MYARKKGKARSKRPQIAAVWVGYSPEEVERLVVKLSKDGLQSAQIGLALRDQYGIPLVRAVTKKTIGQILVENQLGPKIPEDLFNLLRKAVRLHAHLLLNKRDAHGKRGLELMESRIRRLVKYYIVTERLPAGWAYDPETAKLIVEKGA
jgi:small subunit ribosomal protein S15